MKNAIFFFIIMLTVLNCGQLCAQNGQLRTDLSITQPLNANGPANASPGASVANEAATASVNIRAIKDLQSRFAKATGERWSRTDKGFIAFFTNDGYKVRAYYDRKGHWEGTLTYCDESQLPHEIRDVIKRTYYDLAITGVIIAEAQGHKVYFANLEDKSTLKIVRVDDDGEMTVLNDLVKTN